jgi:FkbM family methyltransferase
MKSLIRSLFPKAAWQRLIELRQRYFPTYAKESYSQEGEDMILERFLEFQPIGFYVDIGAHHPLKFSNTYRLYRRGWRGLNVDANPGSMKPFRKIRPRDINVEAAVSSTQQELKYYIFNEPALNTFKKDLALQYASEEHFSIIKEIDITTLPLAQLLDQYMPAGTKIDLLTIDVEGLDYDVLRSNDWSRYTPEFILVECLGSSVPDSASADPVTQLLTEHHYAIVARTMNTVFFRLTPPGSSH